MSDAAGDALTLEAPQERAGGGALRWLLAGYLVFIPNQLETPYDIRFAPSDLFLVAALLLGVRWWRIGGPAWGPWHVGMLGLFVLWTIARILAEGTVAQYVLVNKLGGILLLFSFYMGITSLADGWGDIRFFLRAFAISVVVQNSVNTAVFLACRSFGVEGPLFDTMLSGGYDRLAGMLVDANAYGGMLAVAYAIVLLDMGGTTPLLPRWARLLSLLSLSVGLFLTSSRSAWIGFVVLTLVGSARNPRLLLLVVLLVGLGVAGFAYFAGAEGFDSFMNVSTRQSTIDERLTIGRDALKMFQDHPGFGGGIGAYAEEHDIIVHNSALWFLAEFGLVGFAVFAGFIGWFIVKGVGVYRVVGLGEQGLVAGLVAGHLAMMGFSLGVEASYQRSWWVVLALLGAACAVASQQGSWRGAGARSRVEEGTERGSEDLDPRSAARPPEEGADCHEFVGNRG